MDEARMRTRALLSVAVAAVAAIAFVVLFRRAVDRMPPELTPAAAAAAAARADSARAARNPPRGRGATPAQPEELPRLR
jgi:hypothetical protein